MSQKYPSKHLKQTLWRGEIFLQHFSFLLPFWAPKTGVITGNFVSLSGGGSCNGKSRRIHFLVGTVFECLAEFWYRHLHMYFPCLSNFGARHLCNCENSSCSHCQSRKSHIWIPLFLQLCFLLGAFCTYWQYRHGILSGGEKYGFLNNAFKSRCTKVIKSRVKHGSLG